MLFAPPNAGAPALASAFDQAINGRRIAFKYDLVPQIPCTPTMPACANVAVPTNMPGNATSWPFEHVAASITVNATDMPVQQAKWDELDVVPLTDPADIPAYLWATHVCSYLCWTSQFNGDPNNECILDAQSPAAGNNSICTTSTP